MVATASPNMKITLERQLEKEAKKMQKMKKKVLFEVNEDDSDDDMDIDNLLDNDSDDSIDSDNGHGDNPGSLTLEGVENVNIGDFVLCRYVTKRSSIFYARIVTKEIDADSDVEVEFLRKNTKVDGKFVKTKCARAGHCPHWTNQS